MNQLFNYYQMIRNGFFRQSPSRPDGFEFFTLEYAFGSNVPRGIVADRQWKYLTDIAPTWRASLEEDYQHPKVTRLLEAGDLKPIVFSDVDFALIDRDAQGHIDQYVADRATLESLGFIAQFYAELRDPEILLSEIKGSASTDRCFEIGQDLFYSRLQRLTDNADVFVPARYVVEFSKLLSKSPSELTDEDFRSAISNIDDSFYLFIVDPLSDYIQRGNVPLTRDVQGGHNRMNLIYTTIAAFSHSQVGDDEKLRHSSFGEFNANDHLYPGVREFFQYASSVGLECVAITRGNQIPFTKGSVSQIDDLFDRVHSTLIASRRSSHDLDPHFPDKRIRPYSLAIDNMATEDKVRIIIHETLEMFARKGLDFRSQDELVSAVATYLDRCVFITDSDLDVWGTCPVVCVMALRTPTKREIDEKFSAISSLNNPIAIMNPLGRNDPLHGFEERDVFKSFDPNRTALGRLLLDMSRGRSLSESYSASSTQIAYRLSSLT